MATDNGVEAWGIGQCNQYFLPNWSKPDLFLFKAKENNKDLDDASKKRIKIVQDFDMMRQRKE